MPCAYYHAVRSELARVSGVHGYCWGCHHGEIRVPSLGEYNKYCTSEDPTGCPVYRARGMRPDDAPAREADLIPHA